MRRSLLISLLALLLVGCGEEQITDPEPGIQAGFIAYRTKDGAIHKISSDGGDPVTLVGSTGIDYPEPFASAAGKLFYQSSLGSGRGSTISAVNSDGSGRALLVEAGITSGASIVGAASARPDGGMVAFVTIGGFGPSTKYIPEGASCLYSRAADNRAGTGPEFHMQTRESMTSPAYSPDAEWVAFIVRLEPGIGKLGIAQVPRLGSYGLAGGVPKRWLGAVRMPDDMSRTATPAWSPDGRTIAVVDPLSPRIRIYDITKVVDEDLTTHLKADLSIRTIGPIGEEIVDLDWRPAGDQLAVISRFPGANGPVDQLRIVDMNGAIVAAVETEKPVTRCEWSPDGRQVLIVAGDLYVYDLATRGQRRVASDVGHACWLR